MIDLLTELNLLMAFREGKKSDVPSDVEQIFAYYPLDDQTNPKLVSRIEHAENYRGKVVETESL